jgi:hypothetical protein
MLMMRQKMLLFFIIRDGHFNYYAKNRIKAIGEPLKEYLSADRVKNKIILRKL